MLRGKDLERFRYLEQWVPKHTISQLCSNDLPRKSSSRLLFLRVRVQRGWKLDMGVARRQHEDITIHVALENWIIHTV